MPLQVEDAMPTSKLLLCSYIADLCRHDWLLLLAIEEDGIVAHLCATDTTGKQHEDVAREGACRTIVETLAHQIGHGHVDVVPCAVTRDVADAGMTFVIARSEGEEGRLTVAVDHIKLDVARVGCLHGEVQRIAAVDGREVDTAAADVVAQSAPTACAHFGQHILTLHAKRVVVGGRREREGVFPRIEVLRRSVGTDVRHERVVQILPLRLVVEIDDVVVALGEGKWLFAC